jgi:DNA excision repair protein ERCC-1
MTPCAYLCSGPAVLVPAAARSPNSIIVNRVQKDNPVLRHVRNVPWEFGDIVPDFLLGQTTGAFFLSMRYHSMHPNYLFARIRELGKQYRLRVLMVVVDLGDTQEALQELAKFCVVHDLCMLLAWTLDEAARYLETYKAYENKPPDQLKERVAKDYMSQLASCLTTIKSVNKTDVVTLASTFGCLRDLAAADVEEVRLCPGFGDRKAERVAAMLDEPFTKAKRSKQS